jgi:hypothetical protein
MLDQVCLPRAWVWDREIGFDAPHGLGGTRLVQGQELMRNRPEWIALIIASTWLTATRAVMAKAPCPNLSGNYLIQGEDGQVKISINQHGCDRIKIVRRSGYLGTTTAEKHSLRLDATNQKDSPWLGEAEKCRTSAKFVGSELQVEATTRRGATLTLIYSLSPDRDLLEAALIGRRGDGRGVPSVARRQD